MSTLTRMTSTSTGFGEFMERRLAASTAFVNGDIDPLDQISTHTSPATIFGPGGDAVQGADEVNAANADGASRFEPGGTNGFEVMHQGADEDLAYWVGIQHSVVRMQGQDEPIPMDLRVTEIFRQEQGTWMLVHRHADRLSSASD
jgi:ketosteroid isomerase-like protein